MHVANLIEIIATFESEKVLMLVVISELVDMWFGSDFDILKTEKFLFLPLGKVRTVSSESNIEMLNSSY